LAGTLLFDEKIRQSAALVEILPIFYSRAAIQRTIVDSPAFLETSLAEEMAVCAHTIRLPNK
jgi:hypothetical protein